MRSLSIILLLISSVVARSQDSISLSRDSLNVDTVMTIHDIVVKGHRKTIKMKENMLMVDVENDEVMKSQNTIYEMLGKIPGVVYNGESVTVLMKSPVYYINGRKVYDSTELIALSVDQVKSVKLLTSADVKYNADGKPVIDIRTKRLGDGLGYNLQGNLTWLKYPKQYYSLNSSYNYDKWDFFLDYRYGRNKQQEDITSGTDILGNPNWNILDKSEELKRSFTHSYKVGMAYNFTPESQLSIQYFGNYSDNDANKQNAMQVSSDTGIASRLNSNYGSGSDDWNHHLNIYYQNELSNQWSMTIYGDYIRMSQNSDTNIGENGHDGHKAVNYGIDSKWDVLAAKTDISHSFQKYGSISFGYDFSHSWGNEKIAYAESGNRGDTHTKETKNAIYTTYSLPLGIFSVDAGIRFQNVNQTSKDKISGNSYHTNEYNLLPTLGISYMNGELMQNLNYSMQRQRPDFTSMNENKTYVNRYNQTEGNMELKTSVENSLNYMLMYRFLMVNVSYSHIHNYMLDTYYGRIEGDPVMVSKTENIKTYQTLTTMINLRRTFGWWTPSLTWLMMKQFLNYSGMDNMTYHLNRPIVFFIFDNNLSLPKQFTLTSRFNIQTNGYLQTMEVKPTTTFDVSLKKTFFKDKLVLSLDVNDLFNSCHNKARICLNNIEYDFNNHSLTRKFGITLKYRFRKNKEQQRSIAAEDELRRLGINED